MATIIFKYALAECEQCRVLIQLANSGVDADTTDISFLAILLKYGLAGHFCHVFGVHRVHLAFAAKFQHLCLRAFQALFV